MSGTTSSTTSRGGGASAWLSQSIGTCLWPWGKGKEKRKGRTNVEVIPPLCYCGKQRPTLVRLSLRGGRWVVDGHVET